MLHGNPVDPLLSQSAHHLNASMTTLSIIGKQRSSIMVTSTTPKRMAVLYPTQELFNFSPFGLGCRQCEINIPIQMEERCIRDHLKKHGQSCSIAFVRSLLDMFKAQVDVAKASGTIEPYRSDNNTYSGYTCICGQHFHSRKGSAIRHCKKAGCDASKLENIQMIKLCCG